MPRLKKVHEVAAERLRAFQTSGEPLPEVPRESEHDKFEAAVHELLKAELNDYDRDQGFGYDPYSHAQRYAFRMRCRLHVRPKLTREDILAGSMPHDSKVIGHVIVDRWVTITPEDLPRDAREWQAFCADVEVEFTDMVKRIAAGDAELTV